MQNFKLGGADDDHAQERLGDTDLIRVGEQTDTLLLSVIIPVWNDERRICKTLDALANQSASRKAFEVIVIDNGSTDGTADIIRRFDWVKLLSEPAPGSYRARNLAVKHARGEWLLFTDGDCIPAGDWVENAIRQLQLNPAIGVIGGKIALFREEGSRGIPYLYEQLMAFNQEKNIASERCVTANWLSPKALIEKFGGFNSDLLSGGDVDLSNRLREAGAKFLYAPQMVVGHPSRATLADLVSKRRRVLGGRFVLQDMRKVRARYWLGQFAREALDEISVVKAADLPAIKKAGLFAVCVVLLFTSQLEFFALSLGKSPHRS